MMKPSREYTANSEWVSLFRKEITLFIRFEAIRYYIHFTMTIIFIISDSEWQCNVRLTQTLETLVFSARITLFPIPTPSPLISTDPTLLKMDRHHFITLLFGSLGPKKTSWNCVPWFPFDWACREWWESEGVWLSLRPDVCTVEHNTPVQYG